MCEAVERYAKKKAKEAVQELIKNMTVYGLSLELISEITSLHIDEIKSLAA